MLARLPSGPFTCIQQVQKFACQNKDKLLSELKENNSKEVKDEIVKYKKFYEDMEHATKQVMDDNEDVQKSVLELYGRISDMEVRAETERGGDISGIVSCLHTDFILQCNHLRSMINLVLSTIAQKQYRAWNDKTSGEMGEYPQDLQRDNGRTPKRVFESCATEQQKIKYKSCDRMQTLEGAVEHGVSNGKNCCSNDLLGIGNQWSVPVIFTDAKMNANSHDTEEKTKGDENNIPGAVNRKSMSFDEAQFSPSEEAENMNLKENNVPEVDISAISSPSEEAGSMYIKHTVQEVGGHAMMDTSEVNAGSAIGGNAHCCINSSDVGNGNTYSSGQRCNTLNNIFGLIKPKILKKTEEEEIIRKLRQKPTPNMVSLEDVQNLNRKGSGSVKMSNTKNHQYGLSGKRDMTAIDGSHGALVKLPGFHPYDDITNKGSFSTPPSDLRTLEDSLKEFGLLGRLHQLDKSLENVRRRKTTVEEHEAECKMFDKEMQKLSQKYHPDSVMNRGGSAEEVTHAQKLQTALNATRTVMKTLNKMFLEDIDIDHKYEFFTKLDIGLLGNEDEVENHVYDVLFKISLISEIKQEGIVAEIRKFLKAAQDCVKSYIDGSPDSFVNNRNLSLHHLTRCITGYEKLIGEFAEVENDCRNEKMHNIYPLIRRMRSDCSKQLKHLQALFELSKRPPKHFKIYKNTHNLDEFFVLPFVWHINVLMTCNMMMRKTAGKNASSSWLKSIFGGKNDREGASLLEHYLPSYMGDHRSDVQVEILGDDDVSLLYYLASYNDADKQIKRTVKELLGKNSITETDIEEAFVARLEVVYKDLISTFKIDDYVENSTRRYIAKELKLCKEMKAEFEKEKEDIVNDIEQMKKHQEDMIKRLDKLLSNSQEISNEIKECAEDTKMFKQKIKSYSREKDFVYEEAKEK